MNRRLVVADWFQPGGFVGAPYFLGVFMFKSLAFGLAATTALFSATTPVAATVIVAGAPPVNYSPFVGPFGTQLAVSQDTITALNFSALFRSAVYRQASGTLDFWFQVERTGAGTLHDREITKFNVQDFAGFAVDGQVIAVDPDGAGVFTTPFNPTPAGGSTTNVFRSPNGAFVETNFWGTGFNGLIGTERSVVYVLRTNAVRFTTGTYGVLAGGSSAEGLTYAPTAVPEPAAWALMLAGFGLIGGAARRSQKVRAVLA